jgi:hypothetical protein
VKKTILSTILAILLLSNLVSALTIEIGIKNSFGIGETASFTYTITSDSSQNITFLPHITCPNVPIALLQEKIVQLQAGKLYKDTYTNIKVEDWIEPQTCTAYIRVLSPVQQYASKNFTIATNPSFSFELRTCKDSACGQKAKIFYLNEKIYLDYDASVSEPTITVTLTYPGKTTKQIDLLSSIKAEQIGTYELDVTASKQGYKTITIKEQFSVIEGPANIQYTEPRDETVEARGRAEEEAGSTEERDMFLIYTTLAAIAIIAAVSTVYHSKRRKRQLVSKLEGILEKRK